MNMLLSTLRSMPVIAIHPLALVTYVLVAGAWLLSHLRTSRFKVLMLRIEQLPPKDRKSVLATEMNAVIPDSISPEEWLRGKRQTYIVVAYVITFIGLLFILYLAYSNRGGLEIDSVRTKTAFFSLIAVALADASNAPASTLQQRSDVTQHEYKFDFIIRNSSGSPINITDCTVAFDPNDNGFLSGALEISETYVVVVRSTETSSVVSKSENVAAYAWYPTDDGRTLLVRTPLHQTLPPLTTDRFIIDIHFPVHYIFRGSMKEAQLTFTWNGNHTSTALVQLQKE